MLLDFDSHSEKECLPLTLMVILNKNAPFIGGQKYFLTLLVIGNKSVPSHWYLVGKRRHPYINGQCKEEFLL